MDEGKKFIKQSLSIHEILGNDEKAAWLSSCANEHLGLDLPVNMELDPKRKSLFLQ